MNIVSVVVSQYVDLCVWWEEGVRFCSVLVAFDVTDVDMDREL
jgi:hypothetical protein